MFGPRRPACLQHQCKQEHNNTMVRGYFTAIVVRLSLLVAQGIYKGLNRDAYILALYSETLVHTHTHFDWCVKNSCDGMIFVSLRDTSPLLSL